MLFLKYNTASQIVQIGPFLDDTDGKTAETGLTIANTDIKLNKGGASTQTDKNSGGATHIANGYYYTTLDATDTTALGRLVLSVNVAGALPVWHEYMVLPAAIYDSFVGGSDVLPVDVTQWNGTNVATPDTAGYPKVTLKSGTGTGEVSLSSGTVTAGTVSDKTGYSLTQAFPTNFSSLAITGGGAVTAGTVSDKTGYSLTQSFPANFADLAVTASTGKVTVGTNDDKTGYTASTVSDKTGYSLATDQSTVIVGTVNALGAQAKADVNAEVDSALNTAIPGTPLADSINERVKTIDDNAASVSDIWGYSTRTLSEAISLKKNVAYANFMFVMRDSTNHNPATGKSVSAYRTIDAGSEASCANSVSEVSSGIYRLGLAATDLNGDSVMFRFAATACDDLFIHIKTTA